MTLQELSQHYDLRRKLKKDEGILAALREAAYPKSPVLSDMPHAPGVRDEARHGKAFAGLLKRYFGE